MHTLAVKQNFVHAAKAGPLVLFNRNGDYLRSGMADPVWNMTPIKTFTAEYSKRGATQNIKTFCIFYRQSLSEPDIFPTYKYTSSHVKYPNDNDWENRTRTIHYTEDPLYCLNIFVYVSILVLCRIF